MRISKVQRKAGTVFCNAYTLSGCYKLKRTETKEEALDRCEKALLEIEDPPKFGDLIKLVRGDFDGLYIWGGTGIMNLGDDGYGFESLPNNFRVLENLIAVDGSEATFPLLYWHDLHYKGLVGIKHNDYVWFNHTWYKAELLANMVYDTKLTGQYVLYSYFIYREKKMYVGILFPDDTYNDAIDEMEDMGQRDELLKLVSEGMTEHEALLSKGYDPFKFEEGTMKLADKYLQALKEKFVQRISSDELRPFNLKNSSEGCEENQDLLGKVLWWDLDLERNE